MTGSYWVGVPPYGNPELYRRRDEADPGQDRAGRRN